MISRISKHAPPRIFGRSEAEQWFSLWHSTTGSFTTHESTKVSPAYLPYSPAGPELRLGHWFPPPFPPPVPPASGTEWFIVAAGQQTGPLGQQQLRDAARAGKLTRDTLVWRKGMASWSKAGEVPELADLVSEIPPPLPPG